MMRTFKQCWSALIWRGLRTASLVAALLILNRMEHFPGQGAPFAAGVGYFLLSAPLDQVSIRVAVLQWLGLAVIFSVGLLIRVFGAATGSVLDLAAAIALFATYERRHNMLLRADPWHGEP